MDKIEMGVAKFPILFPFLSFSFPPISWLPNRDKRKPKRKLTWTKTGRVVDSP